MYIFEQLEHDSNQRTEATAPAKTLSMGSGRGCFRQQPDKGQWVDFMNKLLR